MPREWEPISRPRAPSPPPPSSPMAHLAAPWAPLRCGYGGRPARGLLGLTGAGSPRSNRRAVAAAGAPPAGARRCVGRKQCGPCTWRRLDAAPWPFNRHVHPGPRPSWCVQAPIHHASALSPGPFVSKGPLPRTCGSAPPPSRRRFGNVSCSHQLVVEPGWARTRGRPSLLAPRSWPAARRRPPRPAHETSPPPTHPAESPWRTQPSGVARPPVCRCPPAPPLATARRARARRKGAQTARLAPPSARRAAGCARIGCGGPPKNARDAPRPTPPPPPAPPPLQQRSPPSFPAEALSRAADPPPTPHQGGCTRPRRGPHPACAAETDSRRGPPTVGTHSGLGGALGRVAHRRPCARAVVGQRPAR